MAKAAGQVTLGGKSAINVTLRLDTPLMLRIEAHLYKQMCANIIERGSRADSSISNLFRAAITNYLDKHDAKAAKDKPISLSPRAIKPRKAKTE